MADGKTFEYGSSASEVQFQDEVGKIKNRQGEAVLEVNDDQQIFLAGSEAVKIGTFIDDDSMATATATSLATSESIKAYVDASSGGGGSSTFTDVAVDTNTLVANITGYTDKVGVGTATPRSTLDVLDASNPQLRVSQADDSVYADVQAKSTGGVHITPTGGTYAGHTFLKSGSSSSYLVVQNITTGNTDDRTKGLTVGAGSNIAYLWMRSSSGSAGQLKIGVDGANAITVDASNNTTAVNNLSANGDVTIGDASGDNHTVNGTMTFANPPSLDQINDASGDTVLTIDASANITFSNNVSVTAGGTINMPSTVTLPNTANGTVTTSAVAVDSNGKDLTVAAGSTTGGSGTDNTGTGGDLAIKPGAGKGSAIGGDVVIQTAPASSGGGATVINTYSTQMIVKESGNIGMGTTGPDRKLDILDASNPQLRLTHTDGSKFTDLQTDTSQHFTVDAGGDIKLDSGSTNATVKLLGGGSDKASIDATSDDISFSVATADKDFMVKGNDSDGGGAITALTIDFSEAGRAVFNNNIRVGGNVIEASDGGATITMDTSDNVTIAGDVQVSGNDIKDSGGNTALTFDGSGNISNDVVVTGSLAYKPKTVVHAAASEAGPATVATSGSTYLITDESGFLTLPEAVDANRGTQYVVMNGTGVDSDTGSGMVRRTGSTDSFYTGSTTSTSVEVGKYAAKTFIVIGDDKWLVVG